MNNNLIQLGVLDLCFQMFYEPFDESFEGKWIFSEKDYYQGLLCFSFSHFHFLYPFFFLLLLFIEI